MTHGDHLCGSCPGNDKQEAVKYCSDCQINLCENCLFYHSTFHQSKDHNVINIKLKGATVSPYLENPAEQVMCGKHPKIEMDMYCMDCGMVICLKCFALQHTKHEVKEVEEVINNEKDKLILELKIIEDNLNEVNQEIANLKNTELDFRDHEKNIIQQIDVHSNKIIKGIQDKVMALKKRVSSYTDLMIAKVKLYEKDYNNSKENLVDLQKEVMNKINRFSIEHLLDKKVNDCIKQDLRTYINKFKIGYNLTFKMKNISLDLGALLTKDLSVKLINSTNSLRLQSILTSEKGVHSLCIDEYMDVLIVADHTSKMIYFLDLDDFQLIKKSRYSDFSSCIVVYGNLFISFESESNICKINSMFLPNVILKHSYFTRSMTLTFKSDNEFFFFNENGFKLGICTITSEGEFVVATQIELDKPILSCIQFNETVLCCYAEDMDDTFQLGRIDMQTSEVTSVPRLSFHYDPLNFIPMTCISGKNILIIHEQTRLHFLNEEFSHLFEYDLTNTCIPSMMICDEKRNRIIISCYDEPSALVLDYNVQEDSICDE